MKRHLALLLSLAAVLACVTILPNSAHAGSVDVGRLMRLARAAIVVPNEWSGVWSVIDSTYTCAGVYQSVDTYEDTLCAGQEISTTEDTTVHFDCTGSADANSINVTCTGTAEPIPDCTATFTIVIHGTRTNDTSHLVSTITSNYSGTAPACVYFPSDCSQSDQTATRISAPPLAYCTTTPTRPATWGEVKLHYR